ncbi:MAG TPA: serine/threonine-protein kinase [Anaeromyxobacteraceae bacterium]|nr:serine/threonine-protein kinase [Anaeromyxobacteraceae bacterium]
MIRRMDRYELIEQVGSGGMAVVYRSRDTALDREVAVKVLHPHLAARAESRARFSREARAVARLNHPNIVEIYDYAGESALESFLVTEFVHGRTLRAFADEEGIEWPEVAALFSRVLADALVHAHAAGVIHRDLKPENVLVLEVGQVRAVKLVDFGIARLLTSDERMTMTGALVGSPNHMAPEIIDGHEADARSDVFSLGTILYWLATGQMPFAAPNPTATLRRVVEGDHTDPRQISPLVSDVLAGVIERALERDPAKRTPSAAALRAELDTALAAAGLAQAEDELRKFLDDPAAYKRALPGRLVPFALARANEALARGETARAMKLLDRVLTLEPENAAVKGRLARIASRSRLKRRAKRLAGTLVLAGILVTLLAGGFLSPPFRRLGTTGSRGHPLPPGAPPRPSAQSPATAHPRPSSASVRAAEAVQKRAPAEARSSQVTVHVSPYAQRALLDGAEIARGEGKVTFALAPGKPHRIQIEHPCCFPFVKDFAAGEALPQPLVLKERLSPRPARLRIEADPRTHVFLNGTLAGTAADSQRSPFEIPIPAAGESPYQSTVDLRLELEGHETLNAVVHLRAGGDLIFAGNTGQASAPPTTEMGMPSQRGSP